MLQDFNSVPKYNFKTLSGESPLVSLFRWGTIDQNYDFGEPHIHTYFHEIFIFEEGGGTHLMGKKSFDAQSNAVHVLPCYYVHQLKRAKTSRGFSIGCTEEFIQQIQAFNPNINFDTMFSFPNCISIPKTEFDHLQFYFKEAFRTEKEDQASFLNLTAIIFTFLSKHHNTDKTISQSAHCFVDKISKLIHQNYNTRPQASFYAQQCNLSVSSFKQQMKLHFGKSISYIQNEKSYAIAKALLQKNELSISQIAFQLGFSSPSHFSRFFLKHEQMTPNSFRKQNNNV
ncbi:MAG: helix-turn-helix domain-containing protein [Flavobacteriales bacterium]